jgi:hypothetical protein
MDSSSTNENQVVHLQVKSRCRQVVLRALVAEMQNVARLRLVKRIVQIQLPPGVPPRGIGPENTT